ncbi:hypothetical protein GOP47_0018581 [Adiantum capillus-veneris]|uniref:Trichome birefringence-like N-terminal domain-containing protein n=1 Tax=Adiantum capillus-veneris TaxID=13818 RepID=A0A9D4UDZ5_ADICA|nr:hypothetical protein GOP47_0018581 [Adiantum capillus-veneris]
MLQHGGRLSSSAAEHPDLFYSGVASSSASHLRSLPVTAATGLCDLSHGRWVPDTQPPLYTNDTCRHIHPSQNCLQNARPDKGYLNWRWKPVMCELLPFDGMQFLGLMRGKRLVFIGDSISRNHMQSLQCALSQVESPQNLYSDERGKAFTWHFPSHNFTLANIWSPFLVNHSVEQNLYKLYLDVPDMAWTSQLRQYDVAIISTGYWYFRPSLYYLKNGVLGANSYAQLNITTIKLVPTLKVALKRVFKYIAKEYKGIVMLRTVTVDHFEHGSWNDGGICNRTSPYAETDNLLSMPWMNSEINKVQIEEFEKSAARSREPWRYEILNVTYSAFLRPDGHPGPYRIQEPSEPVFDCLHWCLPGPIDMWNQLVLHTIQNYSPRKSA